MEKQFLCCLYKTGVISASISSWYLFCLLLEQWILLTALIAWRLLPDGDLFHTATSIPNWTTGWFIQWMSPSSCQSLLYHQQNITEIIRLTVCTCQKNLWRQREGERERVFVLKFSDLTCVCWFMSLHMRLNSESRKKNTNIYISINTLGVVPHHATRRLCVIPKKRLTYFTHFTYVPQPGVGWGGGGVGCNDMHCHANNCTCAHVGCYAIALAHMLDATQFHLRTCWMLRNCTCAHVGCYAIALAHMLDATQLHLRTCWMLRNCTCAHVGCYAIALAHMLDATQLHLRTCWMLRNCTCAHVGCYAIALAHMLDATQLHLCTCWMLRNCTCAHVGCYAIALAHMLDATQLHMRTCWMLRNCTCAHVGCYAIALAHMLDATQLHLRTCWMLRNCTCAHVRCYANALAHIP